MNAVESDYESASSYKNPRKSHLLDNVSRILSSSALAVIEINGMKTSDIFKIKTKIWKCDSDSNISLSKNSLTLKAAEKLGIKFVSDAVKSGTIMIAHCNDDIPGLFKSLLEFEKEHKSQFKVSACGIDRQFLPKDVVKEISELQDINHIYGRVVGVIQAAASGLVHSIKAPAFSIVRCLDCYSATAGN